MEKQLVILIAGKATRLAPLSFTLPKGLMTINQKPACFNMIADLATNEEVCDVTFVTSTANNLIVREFAEKSFGGGYIKLNYVIQDNPQGPLHAFQLCRELITKPTILLLGDTLCETDLNYGYDWIGYKTISDNSHSRWCLIKTNADEVVTDIIDKPDYTPETNKVLIGLYYFTNPELLRNCLGKQYPKIRNELQLSSLISEYGKSQRIKGMRINSWYDTGTLKDYNQTLAKNIAGRNFNKFKLDEFGVLTKESSYLKLKSEIMWLKEISRRRLGYLIPNYFGSTVKKVDGNEVVSYKTEFVNGSTLTEYFNYYKIGQNNWAYIFDKLLRTLNELWKHKAPKDFDIKDCSRFMYIDKTLERIKQWSRQDVLEQDVIYANGEPLAGVYKIFPKLMPAFEKLVEDSRKFATIIHGDSCFSNIIFFPPSGTFKLLDPRGNFKIDTIYGDCRYDIAKLRHNYHGLYDLITLNLFNMTERSCNDFEYHFYSNDMISPDVFDRIIAAHGFNVDDIELIEGLLFISMIPLHSDNSNTQILYYITGLKCLNNQLKKRGLE